MKLFYGPVGACTPEQMRQAKQLKALGRRGCVQVRHDLVGRRPGDRHVHVPRFPVPAANEVSRYKERVDVSATE